MLNGPPGGLPKASPIERTFGILLMIVLIVLFSLGMGIAYKRDVLDQNPDKPWTVNPDVRTP